jgi:hypothetical protein
MSTTPDVSVELAMEVRTSSAVDVRAEFTRHVVEIVRVATTLSNLKGTYVKILRDAASYITAAWKNESPSRTGPAHNSGTAATRLAEARLSALQEENTAFRQEISRRAACAHECPLCSGSASESGRPLRECKSDSARIDALQKRFDEFGPFIIRAIEERFGGRRLCTLNPDARRITLPLAAPPKHRRSGESRMEVNGGW